MLRLLPEVGVTLPNGAGVLRFGITPDEVRALLAAAAKVQWHRQCTALTLTQYRELRDAHDAWLKGILFEPGWNINAIFNGVSLGVGGGGHEVKADALFSADIPGARP